MDGPVFFGRMKLQLDPEHRQSGMNRSGTSPPFDGMNGESLIDDVCPEIGELQLLKLHL